MGDIGVTMFIRVYSPLGATSEQSFSIGRLVGLQDIYIPFSQFSGSTDFSNVGALEIEFPFSEKLDLTIEDFDVVSVSTRDPVYEFVRPIEGEYIDFQERCEKEVRSSSARSFTDDFSFITSTTSSVVALLPNLFIIFISLVVLVI